MAECELVCVIPGPTKELARQPAGVRWCFGCRKHLPHDDVIVGDEGPSWYDPVLVRQCSRCGQDRTTFPRRDLWA
jgi:hypothetical protein